MNKKALDGEHYKTYHSEGWENPDLLELTTTDENEGLYIIRQSMEIKDAPVCPHCTTSECFRATERHGWDKYYCDRILTRYFDLKVPYRDIFYLKRCTANPEHMYLLNQRITKGFLLDNEFHFRCQFCDSPDLEFNGTFKSPRIYWGNLWAKCFSKYSCNTCGQHTIVIKRSDLVVSADTLYRKLKPIEKEIIGETKIIEGIAPEIERIVTQVFDSKTFEILEKIRKESSLAYSKEIKSNGEKSEVEKTEYDKIEIDFSDKKEIRIDNKSPIPMRTKKGIRQEFLLLEEVLNSRGEIHWSAGFILFKKWQENVPKEGPVEQFRSVVSDLKRAVGINLLTPSNKETVRSWELNKDIPIESTIEKSKVACKEAKKTDDLLHKAEELKKAFLFYPNSIGASKLLVELAEKCKDSVTLDMDLEHKKTDAVRLIRIREENLKSSISMIKTKGLECEWKGDWQEVNEYLWLMIKECSEIEQYKIRGEGILKNIRVDPDEARCQELISMIISMSGLGVDNVIFNNFINEPVIHESIKITSSKFIQRIADRKWPKEEYRDIKDRAMDFLCEEINHWKHPDLKKTNELKNYLVANISYRLLEWFLEDKFAIPIEKQRDLWHLESVRRKLKKKLGSNPSVEEQLKELGPKWDRSRIGEIVRYEGNKSGFFDIAKEYEYFDELGLDSEDFLAILEKEL